MSWNSLLLLLLPINIKSSYENDIKCKEAIQSEDAIREKSNNIIQNENINTYSDTIHDLKAAHKIPWIKKIRIVFKIAAGYLKHIYSVPFIKHEFYKKYNALKKLTDREKEIDERCDDLDIEMNSLVEILCGRYKIDRNAFLYDNFSLNTSDQELEQLQKLQKENRLLASEAGTISEFIENIIWEMGREYEENEYEDWFIDQQSFHFANKEVSIEITTHLMYVHLFNANGNLIYYDILNYNHSLRSFLYAPWNIKHCYYRIIRMKMYCGPKLGIVNAQKISDYEHRINFESYLVCNTETLKEVMKIQTEEELEKLDIIAPDDLNKMKWIHLSSYVEEKFENDNFYCEPPVKWEEFVDL